VLQGLRVLLLQQVAEERPVELLLVLEVLVEH
jgi:hypothetical protein